jgi:hypothetical protein
MARPMRMRMTIGLSFLRRAPTIRCFGSGAKVLSGARFADCGECVEARGPFLEEGDRNALNIDGVGDSWPF